MNLDQIMGVKEAGEMWGLSADRVKGLCQSNEVVAKKIGNSWVLDKNQPNPKGGRKMKKFEDLNERNSTLFYWKGEKIAGKPLMLGTIQDPYPSDWNNGEPLTYEAIALDVFENHYKVIWEVVDPEITDESSICDWDNPIKVEKL